MAQMPSQNERTHFPRAFTQGCATELGYSGQYSKLNQKSVQYALHIV